MKMKKTQRKLNLKSILIALILGVCIFTLNTDSSFSLPTHDEVVSGDVEFTQPNDQTLEITASDNAIINFTSFDIAQNESVIVHLPSADAELLNRVLGGSATELFGDLDCNGIFIFINEAGLHIGPSANIDAAGFILSTRDIANSDFLNGDYLFTRLSKEQVDKLLLNEGTLNVGSGGFAALVAGAIENDGTIIAPMGKVALISGDAVRLDISGDGLISVAIDEEVASTVLDYEGQAITEQIKNIGTLQANGGAVILDAESVTDVFEKAINLEGYVVANRLEDQDGLVRIIADNDVEINAEITATSIEVGHPDLGVPENVQVLGGSLEAEEDVQVLADNDIELEADITTEEGDITLFADYDADGEGSFYQGEDATIAAGGEGDVYIDASETMELRTISVENGYIKIGENRAPQSITGSPHYIHTAGDFEIIEKAEEGSVTTITTSRDDILRYDTEQSLTLEAQDGQIIDQTDTPLYGGSLNLIGEGIEIDTFAPTIDIYKTLGDLSITTSSIQGDTVTLEGEGLKVSYLTSTDVTLRSNGSIDTQDVAIISGQRINLVSRLFGTYGQPLNIEANNINISRIDGDIDIRDSLGIGTSILFRGPPDGWGAIRYNKEANFALETNNLILSGVNPTHFYGDITIWSEENLIITGNIVLEDGVTLRLFSDHNSALSGDWHDGVGSITQSGDYTISASEAAESSILYLEGGDGIGTSEVPLGTNVHSLSAEVYTPGSSLYITQGENTLTLGNITVPGGVVDINSARNMILEHTIDVSAVGEVNAGSVNLFATNGLSLHSGSLITANAGLNGNGGEVIVYSPNMTLFWEGARIEAKGGSLSGNGGFAEVSGKEYMVFQGRIDLTAANGSLGTLLIDPKNITISDGGVFVVADYDEFSEFASDDADFSDESIEAALDGADLVLQANNDITINYAINSFGGAGGNLTLQAGRSIIFNSSVTIKGSFTATANDTNADPLNRDSGAAEFTMGDGYTINTSASNGNITITMETGAGAGQTSGDITLEKLNAGLGHILVKNNGATLGSDILRASEDSLFTAASVALDISNVTNTTGAIGKSDGPIRVTTTNFEARGAGGGVYVISPAQGVTLGGATLGGLTGVSTTNNGDIDITTDVGNLSTSEAISANGSGTVTLSATALAATLTIGASGDVDSLSGLITLSADGNVTLDIGGTVGAATTGGITITADLDGDGLGTLAVYGDIGTLLTTTGDITLTAASITLGADITSTGAAILQPSTAARTIGIAGGTGDFSLSAIEIAYLTDGFSSITIGGASGKGAVTINAITFNDPVTIRTPDTGGTITVNGKITGAGDATILLDGGSATTLNADIQTAGKNITISDNVTTGGGSISLSTGADTAGNISITGTTEGTGPESLTLISGTGTITLTGEVSNFNILILQEDEPLLLATGTVTFNGNVTVNGITTYAQPYAIVFNGSATTITNDCTFLNTGGVTLGNGGTDVITFTGGLDTTAGTTTVNGTVNTTNTQMDIGALTLAGHTTLDTGTGTSAKMNIGAVTGAGKYLTLDSGSAAITVASVDNVGILTITKSGGTTFTGSVGAGTPGAVTITDTAGTVAFQGNTSITTLTTGIMSYNLSFTGTTTSITADTDFQNTGTITLGDNAADTLTFTGGLSTTGGPTAVNIGGIVRTTDTQMDLGAITLVANSELDAGTSPTSIMNVGAVTGGGYNLTLDAEDAMITVASVDNVGILTIRDSASTTFSGSVGASTPGAVTITDTSGIVTFGGATKITTLSVTETASYSLTFNGNLTITNPVTFSNLGGGTLGNGSEDIITFNDVTFSGPLTYTLNTALDVNDDFALSLGAVLDCNLNNITIGGDFTNNGTLTSLGTVIFDTVGQTSTIYGSNTFNNFTCTTAGKTLQFEQLGTTTITGTLTLTGQSGNLIRLRSSVEGIWWHINSQGTRSVSYVDVKDSKNTNSQVIDPSSSTDSGNNINWFVVIEVPETEVEVQPDLPEPEAPEDIEIEAPEEVDSDGEVVIESSEEETSSEVVVQITEEEESVEDATVEEESEEETTEESTLIETLEEEVASEETPEGEKNYFTNLGGDARYYKSFYRDGMYCTTVMVYEGEVKVYPYNEDGPKYDEAVTLTTGESISVEKETETTQEEEKEYGEDEITL